MKYLFLLMLTLGSCKVSINSHPNDYHVVCRYMETVLYDGPSVYRPECNQDGCWIWPPDPKMERHFGPAVACFVAPEDK